MCLIGNRIIRISRMCVILWERVASPARSGDRLYCIFLVAAAYITYAYTYIYIYKKISTYKRRIMYTYINISLDR